MKFSYDFIEKVSDSNNIVDIISQYTQLRSTGSGLMGRCPFPDHPEKTPSFSVSEVKQVYHCFGCHKKGNIYTFLQQYSGMSFPEAVEYLANRAGLAIPQESYHDSKDSQEEAEQRNKKKNILRANQLATEYFENSLRRQPENSPVKKYLIKRGLTPEIVKEFRIGFATPEWDSLEKHLTQNGIANVISEEAKLLRARTGDKSGFYDLFRDRLMFPIVSPVGETLAFGGRIIEQGEPKYLNSPETSVFIKGKVLYGLYQTAKHIRSEDLAILVEGYMDLVSLYQSGIKNVAATMGTALTHEHGKLVKRITRNVTVLFDGDSAGIEAAERSLPILLAAELFPKGFIIPEGLDPDDYVKQYGAENLKAELEKAPDLFILILNRWMEKYQGEASEKVRLVDKLKPVFTSMADQRLRGLYIQEVAGRLSVTENWLKNAIFGHSKSEPHANFAKRPSVSVGEKKSLDESFISDLTEKIELKNAPKVELLILGLALKSRANFELVLHESVVELLHNPGVKKILINSAEVYRQDANKFDKLPSLFINKVDQPDMLFLGMEVGPNNTSGNGLDFDVDAENKLISDCIKKIKDNFLKAEAKKLISEIKTAPTTEKLEQIMNVHRNRKSLNKNEN